MYAHLWRGRRMGIPTETVVLLLLSLPALAQTCLKHTVTAGAMHERYGAPPIRGPLLDQTGWGAYLLAGAGVALDRSRRVRLAVTPRAHIVNSAHAWLHRDRWLFLLGESGVGW